MVIIFFKTLTNSPANAEAHQESKNLEQCTKGNAVEASLWAEEWSANGSLRAPHAVEYTDASQ